MSLYFSASIGGFLDDAIHASIPADARPVAAEAHAALIASASSGSIIVPDANGDPVAIPAPAPPASELLRRMRDQRNRLLRASDFTQAPDAPLTDEQRAQWRTYRQALRDLPANVTDPAAVEWPNAPA